MERVTNGSLNFYRFRILQRFPEIAHAVFTREGGVSSGPYHTLNLSYHSGDEETKVIENRERAKKALDADDLVSAHQVHGAEFKVVDHMPAGELNGFDGLLTSLPGVALLIKQADCQAILLFDPVKRAIGNIHCGWRGNTSGIIGHGIKKMKDAFGSKSEDLIACIGPSLGSCCAEFKNYRKEFPRSLWQYEVAPSHFDLWKMSHDQLCAAGLQGSNIETAGICTKCNTNEFFSYRGEKNTGRFGSAIALKKY